MNMKTNVRKMVLLALFTAIVVILQLVGSVIKLGSFSLSLVLVPIVIAAAIYGPGAGAYLGAVFGIVVLISGDAGAFLAINPFGAILTVMLKGVLAGLASGLVYKLLSAKHSFLGVLGAAIACPLVNTGVFLICCTIFFMDYVKNLAYTMGFGSNVAKFMIIGFVGLNFVIELIANIVLSQVIVRIIDFGKKEQ